MRIIMAGGGTGGHIYPALTIAKAIANRTTSCEILFVGTRNGLEADIIPKEGYPLQTIDVGGFERRLSWKNLMNVLKTMGSLWKSRQIIQQFKPDIVIGTGGYVCGPVLLAASILGIPTMIQEQNVFAGVTNKILSRFVDCVAVGYQEAVNCFAAPDKVVFTGNPIRPEVMSAVRDDAYAALGLSRDKFTILVSGGSRGAHTMNQAMLEVHQVFKDKEQIQILHVTGQNDYNYIVGNLKQRGIDVAKAGNSIIKSYLYNMPYALAVADLAIFRAGAIGLAELTARGIPSILIPYPYAAENHQEFNARVLEKNGAAVVIRDKELTGQLLAERIAQLTGNRAQLKTMAEASKRLGCPEAAETLAKLAFQLSGK
ncbi:n-acetylglucosaminyltransferase murg [Lucifera butyrica]|uniref:UDP-N-acetylglucosamine--N-acetylmuramyl-(pentapeptide) pyrophosphoryl-undecaprenol N-acetylglucosamine transferase n=1 Tax=Lucifera butyrica TaxID=1351585 RepID=A0A498R500_9FIRM|nr:undecaprenyldiphospho-muramoylpentapeptide beta-N-acetylglucosaminyltransferase [Lucifera butyrica]VBB06219.1 n-acetylglucosaminyltransferase murg [Lucifera butyrica]